MVGEEGGSVDTAKVRCLCPLQGWPPWYQTRAHGSCSWGSQRAQCWSAESRAHGVRQRSAAQPKVSETQAALLWIYSACGAAVLWACNGRGSPVDFWITLGLFFHCLPQWLLLPLRWLTNLIKWFFIHTLRALPWPYMLILFDMNGLRALHIFKFWLAILSFCHFSHLSLYPKALWETKDTPSTLWLEIASVIYPISLLTVPLQNSKMNTIPVSSLHLYNEDFLSPIVLS